MQCQCADKDNCAWGKNSDDIVQTKLFHNTSIWLLETKQPDPFESGCSNSYLSFGLVIHAAHAARWHWRSFFLFRNLGDECFGGEQQARDRRGVLQRAARDLGRIDDTGFHQVGVFAGGDVVAFVAFALLHFLTTSAPSWPALSAS